MVSIVTTQTASPGLYGFVIFACDFTLAVGLGFSWFVFFGDNFFSFFVTLMFDVVFGDINSCWCFVSSLCLRGRFACKLHVSCMMLHGHGL